MKLPPALLIRVFIFSVAILLKSFGAIAQFDKSDKEMSICAGAASGTQLIGFKILASYSTDNHYYKLTANKGIFFGSFRYYLNKWISLGVTGGVQSFSYAHFSEDFATYIPDFTLNGTVYTISLEMKAFYPRTNLKDFQMYVIVGLGGSYYHETETPKMYPTLHTTFYNSQWSPLCFRYGNNVGIFCELGFGYKGIISGGLSFKIPGRRKYF